MFTGIVTAVGTVREVRRTSEGLSLTISSPYRRLVVGESIAVDGACLTVVRRRAGHFTVRVVAATRDRTNFSDYRPGRSVNLERSLRAGDPLGGHLVAGHVDGVGTVKRRRRVGDSVELEVRVPAAVARYCVPRGSIAIDGVSLTIASLSSPRVVRVALVPHTLASTTLARAGGGARVHLEVDQMAKFVMQQALRYRGRGPRGR